MRQTYIVTYDVCDAKRLRKVFKTMKGYGEHLQLSVFRCELSHRELVELRALLGGIIHHDKDQVLFVDVGPEEGRGNTSISSIGRAYKVPRSDARSWCNRGVARLRAVRGATMPGERSQAARSLTSMEDIGTDWRLPRRSMGLSCAKASGHRSQLAL